MKIGLAAAAAPMSGSTIQQREDRSFQRRGRMFQIVKCSPVAAIKPIGTAASRAQKIATSGVREANMKAKQISHAEAAAAPAKNARASGAFLPRNRMTSPMARTGAAVSPFATDRPVRI